MKLNVMWEACKDACQQLRGGSNPAWRTCGEHCLRVWIPTKGFFSRSWVWVCSVQLALGIGILFLEAAFAAYVFLSVQSGTKLQEWGSIVGIVAGIATIVSLAFVYETLRRTRIVSEAQLLSDFNDKYFEPEMAASIRCLHKFKKLHKDNFTVHRTPVENPYAAMPFPPDEKLRWTRETDEARRRVKGYFLSVTELYEHGMISCSIFEKMIDKNGITALFDVVEPLEWYLSTGYDAKIFSRLMRYIPHIYEKFDSAKKEFDEQPIPRVIDSPPTPHVGIQKFLVSVETVPPVQPR